MKKTKHCIVLLLTLCSSTFVMAQIKQGTTMAGGSFSFATQKAETNANPSTEETNSSFGITPAFGKAIRDNLIVGADLNFANTTSKQNNNTTTKNNIYGLGVFVRPYKNLGNSNFYLYLQGRLGFDVIDGENKSGISSNKVKGFDIGLNLTPGISYAVTPGMHFETGIGNLFYAGYMNRKTTSNSSPTENKSSGFSTGVGLGNTIQWLVGAKFFFGSK